MPTPSIAALASGASTKEATAFLTTQSIFIAIATLLVLTRVYVRIVVVKKFGLDDAFIVLALIASLVTCAMTSLAIHYSTLYFTGQHITEVETSHEDTMATLATKWSSVAAPISQFSLLCIRVSICLSLLRIFSTKRVWKWGLYSIMVFVTAFILATIICLLAQCSPVENLWSPFQSEGCWSQQTLINVGYFNGAASVLCDWILATLPIVFMWNVQLKVKIKVGICVLMGLGYFTGICAIVRTAFYNDSYAEASQGSSVQSGVWSILEINVGIIATSIPTLRPLFNSSRPSILRYFRYRRTSERRRKATESVPANENNDQLRLNKLTLKTMPSSMLSSLSYYKDDARKHSEGREDLESHAGVLGPERLHVTETEREVQTESMLECMRDGKVHIIGDILI